MSTSPTDLPHVGHAPRVDTAARPHPRHRGAGEGSADVGQRRCSCTTSRRGPGPLVLLLHGFPRVLVRLAAAADRARSSRRASGSFAPDLRGYKPLVAAYGTAPTTASTSWPTTSWASSAERGCRGRPFRWSGPRLGRDRRLGNLRDEPPPRVRRPPRRPSMRPTRASSLGRAPPNPKASSKRVPVTSSTSSSPGSPEHHVEGQGLGVSFPATSSRTPTPAYTPREEMNRYNRGPGSQPERLDRDDQLLPLRGAGRRQRRPRAASATRSPPAEPSSSGGGRTAFPSAPTSPSPTAPTCPASTASRRVPGPRRTGCINDAAERVTQNAHRLLRPRAARPRRTRNHARSTERRRSRNLPNRTRSAGSRVLKTRRGTGPGAAPTTRDASAQTTAIAPRLARRRAGRPPGRASDAACSWRRPATSRPAGRRGRP